MVKPKGLLKYYRLLDMQSAAQRTHSMLQQDLLDLTDLLLDLRILLIKGKNFKLNANFALLYGMPEMCK